MTRLLAGSITVLTACTRPPPRPPPPDRPAPTPAAPIATPRATAPTPGARPDGASSRDELCPPGAVLNASIASIDMTALVGAFPRNPFGWQLASADVFAVKRHERWTQRARAVYTHGTDEMEMVIEDMIHHCTGARGTGARLTATEEIHDPAARRRDAEILFGHPGVFVEWGDPTWRRTFVTWFDDRCRVTTESKRGDPGSLSILVEELDFAAIHRACAAR